MIQKDWDLQARWKGNLNGEQKERLKNFLAQEGLSLEAHLRLGFERSRLNVHFKRALLEQELKDHYHWIRTQESIEGMGKEELEELKSLLEQNNQKARELLDPNYLKVSIERRCTQFAIALGALLPASSALSIKLKQEK